MATAAVPSARTAVLSFRTTPQLQHLVQAVAAERGVPVAHFIERLVRDEVAHSLQRVTEEASASRLETPK